MKYLRRLLPLLRRHPDVTELHAFVPPGSGEIIGLQEPTFTWDRHDVYRGFRSVRARLRQLKPDVVFIPTARWIRPGSVPTVIMVRNMEPLADPIGGNAPTEAIRNLARAYAARRACRRATRVIAVSKFVRQSVVEKWRIAPSKVSVVYHGVEQPTASPARPQTLAEPASRPFLLTAGSIRPYRGLEDAIRAVALLARAGLNLQLVVAGPPDPANRAYYRRLIELGRDLGVSGAIHWLGSLAPAELAWCFQHAQAFLMTSRLEACPNLALEAMGYGAPCIATSNPPMPEFFGDTALYYPAGDAQMLADRVTGVTASSNAELSQHRARAQARASEFDWNTTADLTVRQLIAATQTVPPE